MIEWDFMGFEHMQVGDFKLLHRGDSWAFAGWASWPEALYYEARHDATYDPFTETCSNGAAVFADQYKTHWDLGTGVWTSNLAEIRGPSEVPLPAGVPLVISALGLMRPRQAMPPFYMSLRI